MIYYDHITDHEICGFTESENSARIVGFTGQIENGQTETSWDGKLYEKGYAPSKPVQTAKNEKHAELKSIMQSRRNAIRVKFDGDTFDANGSAQENMIVLLKAFDLGAPAVQIRSATEVTHTFDKDTCQQLSLVMLQAVQALYAEYWELKTRLAACETVAEVETITWQEVSK